MTAARDVEQEAAAIEALRQSAPDVAETHLRKALQDRNNYVVSKAAKLTGDLKLKSLSSDLTTAFTRFMVKPVKSDPQCWAKNAIAKALAILEFQEHELFLQGIRHIQLEPVWGGTSDTAGPLRGTCALALVQCRQLNNTVILTHLTELFADKELPVRVNAARAVEQIGTDAAMLLLRLRAELASDEAELLGACYSGVLHLEGPSAIPWAAKFLSPGDDAAAEAAIAIAETRTVDAFTHLKAAYEEARDPWFRSALLSAISLTRQDHAYDWLLGIIKEQGPDGKDAHRALCNSGPPAAILDSLAKLGRPCPPS
jgi:hypothetical protein